MDQIVETGFFDKFTKGIKINNTVDLIVNNIKEIYKDNNDINKLVKELLLLKKEGNKKLMDNFSNKLIKRNNNLNKVNKFKI